MIQNNYFIPQKFRDAQKVFTATGEQVAQPTARVAKNEIIYEPGTGNADIVTRGTEGKDTQLANVKDSTVIFGSLIDPRTGTPFYKNPVTRQAAKLAHEINRIEKGPGKEIDQKRGVIGAQTKQVQQQAIAPIKHNIDKYMNDSAELQRQVRDYTELQKYGNITGFRLGKDYVDLPGFKHSKYGRYGELNEYNALQASMPKDLTPEQEHALMIGRDEFVPNKVLGTHYTSGGVFPRYHINPIQTDADGRKRLMDAISDISNAPVDVKIKPVDTSGIKLPIQQNDDDKHEIIPDDDSHLYRAPWWPNALTTLTNMTYGIGSGIRAAGQRLSAPNFYRANPYAGQALNTLAGLRYDPYWIKKAIGDNRRQLAYNINNQGGLTGSQRYAGRIASALGFNDYISKLDNAAQETNNKYRTQYADALMNAGSQEQQMMANAALNSYKEYSGAHNAREQALQMAAYNVINPMWQYAANEFKRRGYNSALNVFDKKSGTSFKDAWNNASPEEKQALLRYIGGMA